MQLAYVALILLAVPLALYRGGAALQACAVVVGLNWAVLSAWVFLTGDTDAEIAFLLADLVSLYLILAHAGETMPGQMLASSYAGQMLMHVTHIAGHGDAWYYWALLTTIGYGQLAILLFGSLAYRSAGRGLC